MPKSNTFDLYEAYRQKRYTGELYTPDPVRGIPLTLYEQQILDKELGEHPQRPDPIPAARMNWRLEQNNQIQGGVKQLRFDDPVINGFARIAYQRAQIDLAAWRDGPVFPDDTMACEKYPGIDPEGKYCAKDMELAQRLAQLKAVVPALEGDRKAAVEAAITLLENPTGKMQDLLADAKKDFMAIREAERAAKVCPHRMTTGLLERAANSIEINSPAIQTLDQYYTALEHMAGIRKKAPTQKTLDTAKKMGLDTGLVTEPAPRVPPTELTVEFQNFDNVMKQRFFAHPQNWGRSPGQTPTEPKDVIRLDDYVTRYAGATVDTMLNGLFDGKESPVVDPDHPSRTSLITIDGKTVDERMAEEYSKTGKTDFKAWYAENGRKKAAEYVAAGLMAGKHVEVFVPDADGKLPSQPAKLTATGYQPSSELTPVTMSSWERFWNRLGFYKEKAAQVENYERDREERRRTQERIKDSRDRVQARYAAGRISEAAYAQQALLNACFGDHLKQNNMASLSDVRNRLPDENPLKAAPLDAPTYAALCAALMANKDISLKEIMDPNARLEEKRAAGKEVLDLVQAGNVLTNRGVAIGFAWMANQMDKGMKAAAATTNPQADPDFRYAAFCAEAVSNIYRLAGGKIMYVNHEAVQKVYGEAAAAKAMRDGYCARGQLAQPWNTRIEENVNDMLKAQYVMNNIRNNTANKHVEFLYNFTPSHTDVEKAAEQMPGTQAAAKLTEAIKANREDWQHLGKLATGNSLVANAEFKTGPNITADVSDHALDRIRPQEPAKQPAPQVRK